MTGTETTVERRTYSCEEAAHILGISRTAMFEACRNGRVRHLKIGRRVVIPRHVIDQMLDGTEEAQPV